MTDPSELMMIFQLAVILEGASHIILNSVVCCNSIPFSSTEDCWSAAVNVYSCCSTSLSAFVVICILDFGHSNRKLSNCIGDPGLPRGFHKVFSRIRVFSDELALHIRWPKYWSFNFSICLSSGYSELISFRIDSIRIFSRESVLRIRWPKYWSFNFSICPSNEYSGLIFFRIDWFDLLAVQGTSKSLLQHHSSKESILQHSVFFMVQLSYPYMTTGKTIALTRRTFVGKVMSLLFNMLSRLVITFLPRSKCLLISWLQSPFAVLLEPKKIP
ncbi:uncharacterized protein LOC129659044 isoform X3 [Bubalus kerabau]|uniref:uncharacterized protein LOC129659044 isoform X3 n=1 Tax=Bubalus carabanensis TaxID=3119969 RepID=UPI00244EEAF7|nr:uncharacterized protein LOC129659044 isoform X3 [Bubalus carabanensis]